MEELAPGVFVETRLRRVTVGAILTDDGFVLIDTPPYPEDAHHWRMLLSDISDKPILAIVNTDGHRDRVVGNGWFNPPTIVAHDETIAQLRASANGFVEAAVEALISSPLERSRFAGVHLRLPTIGFTRRLILRFGNSTIPLLSMAGPGTGNLWVHLPRERILFAGDSVITDQHPYLISPCSKVWLDNLTELRRPRFAVDRIVPGRGAVVDKHATEPLSNYLRLARRRVFSLFRENRPRSDTATLVPELLEMFPYRPDEADEVQRRIRVGLERIYEEFRAGDKETLLG